MRATGITTRKRSPELLLTIGITSPPEPGFPAGRYDQLHLSNYAVLRLKEELQRLPGISDVTIFGQRDYALRVWVDPEKLSVRNLSAADVLAALRQQNLPVAAGQIGQPPSGTGQPYQFTLAAVGRLVEVEEFEQVVVKRGARGQLVKLKDVARVELGAKSQDVSNLFDNKSTCGLAIFILCKSARDTIVIAPWLARGQRCSCGRRCRALTLAGGLALRLIERQRHRLPHRSAEEPATRRRRDARLPV